MGGKKITLYVVLFISLPAFGQWTKETGLTLGGQANEHFYEIEGAYSFHPNRYVGFGASAQLQFSYKDHIYGTSTKNKDIEWHIDEDDSQVSCLAISPFIRFNTPGIRIWRFNSVSIFAEPMLKMPILNWYSVSADFTQQVSRDSYKTWSKTYSSKFSLISFAPSIALGLELRKNEGALILAYHLSKQDIFRQARTINLEGNSL